MLPNWTALHERKRGFGNCTRSWLQLTEADSEDRREPWIVDRRSRHGVKVFSKLKLKACFVLLVISTPLINRKAVVIRAGFRLYPYLTLHAILCCESPFLFTGTTASFDSVNSSQAANLMPFDTNASSFDILRSKMCMAVLLSIFAKLSSRRLFLDGR